MNDLDMWLALLRTPGLGPAGLREQLRLHGGSIGDAWLALCDRAATLPEETRRWLQQPDRARLDADAAWLAEPGRRLLRYTDEDFPPLLEAIPQPPAALFVVGDASLLLRPQVAIVGARAASLSGKAHARGFAHTR